MKKFLTLFVLAIVCALTFTMFACVAVPSESTGDNSQTEQPDGSTNSTGSPDSSDPSDSTGTEVPYANPVIELVDGEGNVIAVTENFTGRAGDVINVPGAKAKDYLGEDISSEIYVTFSKEVFTVKNSESNNGTYDVVVSEEGTFEFVYNVEDAYEGSAIVTLTFVIEGIKPGYAPIEGGIIEDLYIDWAVTETTFSRERGNITSASVIDVTEKGLDTEFLGTHAVEFKTDTAGSAAYIDFIRGKFIPQYKYKVTANMFIDGFDGEGVVYGALFTDPLSVSGGDYHWALSANNTIEFTIYGKEFSSLCVYIVDTKYTVYLGNITITAEYVKEEENPATLKTPTTEEMVEGFTYDWKNYTTSFTNERGGANTAVVKVADEGIESNYLGEYALKVTTGTAGSAMWFDGLKGIYEPDYTYTVNLKLYVDGFTPVEGQTVLSCAIFNDRSVATAVWGTSAEVELTLTFKGSDAAYGVCFYCPDSIYTWYLGELTITAVANNSDSVVYNWDTLTSAFSTERGAANVATVNVADEGIESEFLGTKAVKITTNTAGSAVRIDALNEYFEEGYTYTLSLKFYTKDFDASKCNLSGALFVDKNVSVVEWGTSGEGVINLTLTAGQVTNGVCFYLPTDIYTFYLGELKIVKEAIQQ